MIDRFGTDGFHHSKAWSILFGQMVWSQSLLVYGHNRKDDEARHTINEI